MASDQHRTEQILSPLKGSLRRLTPEFWTAACIVLFLAVRLAWLGYTRYIDEDAFITFRYARQIALGNGFVYNLGERIYGTTTPLFTLLLAAWIKGSPNNVVLGARLLDLTFSLGAVIMIWQTLKLLGRTTMEIIWAIIILTLATKLCRTDTSGMETPAIFFFIAASWYALAKQRIFWAGVLAGLLLWTRVDLFLWPTILVAVTATSSWKSALRLTTAVILTYLPWMIFATLYFGSPIPFTITAKWVAHIQFNDQPLIYHLSMVARFLSPFDRPYQPNVNIVLVVLTLGLACYQAIRICRDRTLIVLTAFVLLDLTRLVVTRATFATRYMAPALWGLLILAGMALGDLWGRGKTLKPILRVAFRVITALTILTLGITYGVAQATLIRSVQIYRHDRSFTVIGLWLHDHTPAGATVLLEPLGHIGYYADRTMWDEVGIVTPAIVDFNREKIEWQTHFSILNPDYLVLHCDDALYMQGQLGGQDRGLAEQYTFEEQANPLNYDPSHPDAPTAYPDLPRVSCYEVWQRK